MNLKPIQSTISETLLIPLAARAREMNRSHPLLQDRKAAEIFAQIDPGKSIIEGSEMATHGILARTLVMDREIAHMLLQHPDLTIINLGAGLDTRISRIDNGRLRSFEVDLPQVIALRSAFFPENERLRLIAGSVLDSAWIKALGEYDCERTVIVAEGLLMYFPEADVKGLFDLLSHHFPGAHMFCDVVHPYFVGKGISSTFQWGIAKATDIERLAPSLQLVQSWCTGDLVKARQPLFYRLMNVLPGTKNRSQILHLHFVRW